MVAGLLAGAMLVAGCGKNKPSTEVPGDAGVAEAAVDSPEAEPRRFADDGLASYENDLAGYEDRMLSLGLPLAGPVTQTRTSEGRNSLPMTDGGEAGSARCERICELTTNICELRDHICELGSEHPDDLRYQRACERATLDCEHASQACEGCK